MLAERAKAKEAATAHVRLAAKLDFSKRLEKVWKELAAVADRCEKEYLSLTLTAEGGRMHSSVNEQAELERRQQVLEAAQQRTESARRAWERCLRECGVREAPGLRPPTEEHE